ncbi:MAG TPA: hypothetical protein V6D14_24570 [Coleofasciculaceae cyanobacterium]
MTYSDMPVIIPLLATGYLLTIYLLLMLAQRTLKSSGYMANSVTDAYAPYMSTEHATQTDEVERWSLRVSGSTSKELAAELRSAKLTSSLPQKVKQVTSKLT